MTNKHIIDLVVERLTTILEKCASNFRTKALPIDIENSLFGKIKIVTTRKKKNMDDKIF